MKQHKTMCRNYIIICLKHQSPTIDDVLISAQDSTSFHTFGLEGGFYQPEPSIASLPSLRSIHIWEHP